MSGVFAILFLISLIFLIIGLIAPRVLNKRNKSKQLTRKDFGIRFGMFTLLFLVLGSLTAPHQTHTTIQLTPASTKQTATNSATKAASIEIKTTTETKAVPFGKTTVQDGTLAKGTTKVTTPGVDGVETLTYKDTYTDGQLTSHQLVSDTVTTPAVTEVTSVGTYIAPAPAPTPAPTYCTNGTYVNAAGNTVCRPEASPTAPAGATARCADGTYSFSQSRSGTCSHHGGVAEWL